jgi:hypothetical protein
MVSPSFAAASVWRNDPSPLSFVFVTVIVAACSWIAPAQNSSTPMATVVIRLIKTVCIILSLPEWRENSWSGTAFRDYVIALPSNVKDDTRAG